MRKTEEKQQQKISGRMTSICRKCDINCATRGKTYDTYYDATPAFGHFVVTFNCHYGSQILKIVTPEEPIPRLGSSFKSKICLSVCLPKMVHTFIKKKIHKMLKCMKIYALYICSTIYVLVQVYLIYLRSFCANVPHSGTSSTHK